MCIGSSAFNLLSIKTLAWSTEILNGERSPVIEMNLFLNLRYGPYLPLFAVISSP
jgi:hypothetical protein